MRQHRFAKGTSAHVTADRSDGPARRPRNTKPVAEGGTRPHLGTCKDCGVEVIHHRLGGGAHILLDPTDLAPGDPGARYVIMFGFVVPDPLPSHMPDGVPFHRAHVCPPAPLVLET